MPRARLRRGVALLVVGGLTSVALQHPLRSWRAAPDETALSRKTGFVPAPLPGRSLRGSGTSPLAAGLVLGPAGSAVAAESSGTDDIVKEAQRFGRIITQGADEIYDPTTDEGAKGLGLLAKVPEEYAKETVSLSDFLPIVGILVAAVGYGVFVVPQLMDRGDGAKSVLFKDELQGDDESAEPKAEQAPLVKPKKVAKKTYDQDILASAAAASRTREAKNIKAGFAAKSKTAKPKKRTKKRS